MSAVMSQHHQQHHHHQQQHLTHQSSLDMSSSSSSASDDDEESLQGDVTMDQRHFYNQQQQQAAYYHQHQQQYSGGPGQHAQQGGDVIVNVSERQAGGDGDGGGEGSGDDDMYSDDGSSTASIPDENIDFSLTYALHTFLATVEGQASVVKGDSLLLLDDANSYWWLVRVLKTEDVGYIPAENIETPYERLARLNKHRNIDLAAATALEKQAAEVQGRSRLKGFIGSKSRAAKVERSNSGDGDGEGRRVVFAPPTYVDHPGVTWSSDEEGEDEEGEEGEEDEVEEESAEGGADVSDGTGRHEREVGGVDSSLNGRSGGDMEPDDGVEWADEAARLQQERRQQSSMVQPKSNNPFAPKQESAPIEPSGSVQGLGSSTSNSSLGSSSAGHLDPAQAGGDTKRLTATPSVAQGANSSLLPSAMAQQQGARNVSGQSTASVSSVVSSGSNRSGTPTSPPEQDDGKRMKKMRKSSKDDLSDAGGEKKKRGMLGGLFSRNKKDKKGISNSDPRSSEDSIVSGAVEQSPRSEEGGQYRAPTPAEVANQQQQHHQQPLTAGHGLKLQQRDQALQQAYTNKYLHRSPDVHSPTAADAVVQSAAAMRLAAGMGGGQELDGRKPRPASVILSPNPAGPALLNVVRLFAGEHVKSEVSFKTVLVNEATTSNDLIRQAMQRFRIHASGGEAAFYLTVKDVNGEEMELQADEKPLLAFQEAVQRWSDEDETKLDEITPTVKRSSVSSISSVVSLSNHPAIQKLGMNDYSDDSAVKIYIHRRRPGSQQVNLSQYGMPEPNSEFSSYSTQLSTVQESSAGEDTPPGRRVGSDSGTASPPTPQAQQRFNPSLTISTGQASPERFSSPSARFTIQLVIHPQDLPDNSAFDPASDAIIPRALLREKQGAQGGGEEGRRRYFVLPRNATVVEAIEQGLERFGIQEGVVDGGDEVEDRVGKRRSAQKVRYCLVAQSAGQETVLSPSAKLLEAYSNPPNLRPVERSLPENRRRSRDMSFNTGSASDLLPTDPTFVLRRVGARTSSYDKVSSIDGVMQRQQSTPSNLVNAAASESDRGPLSPVEIIAAQRAASRANQKALISAHANATQGVDVVVPDRGTFRSSRLIEGDGEVVRYSYIDGDGETYDISEILEEEWRKDQNQQPSSLSVTRPGVSRQRTDESNYVTAPSTPDEAGPPALSEGQDILRSVLQKAGEDGKLEEKLQRVIHKVKSSSGSFVANPTAEMGGRQTPVGGRTTPTNATRGMAGRPNNESSTPRAIQQTAESVNRIISRHRQHPSIASIMSMSDVSGTGTGPNTKDSPAHSKQQQLQEDDEDADKARTITPVTAASATHPTQQMGSVFVRPVATSRLPTPRQAVKCEDDFGMGRLFAMVQIRGWEYARQAAEDLKSREKSGEAAEGDEVTRLFYGEKVEWEGVHPEIRGCFEGLERKLESWDAEVDELLGMTMRTK